MATGRSRGDTGKPADPVRPRRRTQAERREDAERRLLDATLSLVARRGFSRVTLAEIGEEAGYSRGLPLHRFGSKAGLLQALARRISERFVAQRAAARHSSPGLDVMRLYVEVYFSRNDKEFDTTRTLLVLMTEGFLEDSDLRAVMCDHNRRARQIFVNNIRHGVESGEIRPDVDPESTAAILVGAMRGVMLQWFNDPDLDLTAVKNRFLDIMDTLMLPLPAAAAGRREADKQA